MFRIRCQTSKCFSYRNVHVSGTEMLSSRGEGREALGHSAPALRRRQVKAADRPELLLQGSVRPQDTAALSQQVRNHGRLNAPKEGPGSAPRSLRLRSACTRRPVLLTQTLRGDSVQALWPRKVAACPTPPSWRGGVRTQAHIPAPVHRPSSALGGFSGGGGMTEHPETRVQMWGPHS